MPPKIPEIVLCSEESQQTVMPGAVTSLLTASQLSFIQSSPVIFQQSFFSEYISFPANKGFGEHSLDKQNPHPI